MKLKQLISMGALGLLIGGCSLNNHADTQTELSSEQLIDLIQDGGYILYIRHAQTTEDWADQASPQLDIDDCSTQRKLSSQGINQAKQIGEGIKFHAIPVESVKTSEYCRAWKTAELAFGQYQKTDQLNFLPCEICNQDQISQYKQRVDPLLNQAPSVGKNIVLVGHDDPFEASTGIYPEPMGVTYVIKPIPNQTPQIIGKLTAEEWVIQ